MKIHPPVQHLHEVKKEQKQQEAREYENSPLLRDF